MRKLRLACIAFILLLGLVPTYAQDVDAAKQIYKNAADSVFLVYLNDSSGSPTAQGTAFVVGPRLLVTNAHVVNAGTPVLAVGPVRIPVTVVRRDEKNDLALLRVDVDLTSPALPLRDAVPATGERVYAIGNPEGLEKSISEGLISAIRDVGDRKLLQISSPISHGSSGGPILDTDGKVIGVAVGMLPDGENLNFAVPVEFVKELELTSVHGGSSPDPALPSVSEVASLLAARGRETYSADENSPYQQASAKFQGSMHTAVASIRNVSDLRELACLGVRNWDALDDGIAAARRVQSTAPGPENTALLAYALYQDAWFQHLSVLFSKDGSEDKQNAIQAEGRFLTEAASVAGQIKPLNGAPGDVANFVLGEVEDTRQDYPTAHAYLQKIAEHSIEECGNDLRIVAMRDLISETSSLNRTAEAETWFRKFASIYAPNPADWNSEGDRRFDAKDYLSASDAYERAASGNSDYGYDLCYASVGRFLQPTTDGDKVLSDGRACQDASVKNSDQDAAKQYDKELPLAHVFMGVVLEGRGVHSAALENVREALRAMPGNTLALSTEAEIFDQTGQYQECVSAAQAAIAAGDGKYADDHFRLGSCYFSLENWPMAEGSFRHAIELDPTNAPAMYNLGLSLQRQGFSADARHWFLEASKLKTDPETRQKIEDALRN